MACVVVLALLGLVSAVSALEVTFANPAAIDLPDGTVARTYPSSIMVSRLAGRLTAVSVTVSNLNHTEPDDLDLLLVGPRGQTVVLMSDAGGTNAVTNVTLTFQNGFTRALPDSGRIVSGTYGPTNYGPAGAVDVFPGAPAGPYGSQLQVFNGTDPNGAWNLFVLDDTSTTGLAGRISGGWSLALQTDVVELPRITTQPESQTVEAGGRVTFKVEVTGSGPFGYSWRRNGVTLVPFTTGTPLLTILDVRPEQAGEYSVMVTNAAGGVVSSPAILYVLGPLRIVDEPQSQTLDLGSTNVQLRVTAAGSPPLYYQWFLNGAVLAEATNASLVISNFQIKNAGAYAAIVVGPAVPDGNPCVKTKPSHLRPNVAFLPAAQNQMKSAETLPGIAGTVAGTNTLADKAAGEANHAGRPGGRSVWYRWVAPRTGHATFHTQGSAFDTLLAVYAESIDGATTPVAADEDNGGYYTSWLRFKAVEGRVFLIAVDGFGGASGDFLLNWTIESVASAPGIAVAPLPQTVVAGQDAKFEVTPDGPAAGLTYQWLFDGVPIGGATGPVYIRTNVQRQQIGNYSVRLTDGAGQNVETAPVALEIGPDPSVQFARKRGDLADFVPGPAGFAPASLPAGPVAGTIVVPVGEDRYHEFKTNQPPAQVPLVCDDCLEGKYFYWLKAVDEGSFELNSAASDYPQVMAVYEFTNTLDKLSRIVCSTNGPVTFVPRKGLTNIVALEAVKDPTQPPPSSGIIRLSWKLTPPCYTLSPGTNVTLTTAPPRVGPAPHHYQWRLNGTDIAGATGSALALANLQGSQAGTYTVFISNNATQELKTIAFVKVEGPLQLQAQVLWEEGEVQPVLRLRGQWTEPFVLETKTFLPPAMPWQPLLTNRDPCQLLFYTNPITGPQQFFRAVQWFPPP